MKKHAVLIAWIIAVLWVVVFLGGSALLYYVWGEESWSRLGILGGLAPFVWYAVVLHLETR